MQTDYNARMAELEEKQNIIEELTTILFLAAHLTEETDLKTLKKLHYLLNKAVVNETLY